MHTRSRMGRVGRAGISDMENLGQALNLRARARVASFPLVVWVAGIGAVQVGTPLFDSVKELDYVTRKSFHVNSNVENLGYAGQSAGKTSLSVLPSRG